MSEVPILVSCGCCNKLPQTGWLKITEINSLSILEVGSPKSVSLGQNQDVIRAVLPPDTVEENPLLLQFRAAPDFLRFVTT